MLGVDDRLLPVVRPGVRTGGAERDSVRGRQRKQAAAVVLLCRARMLQRLPLPDRISISDEISSPATEPASAGSASAAFDSVS